MTKKTIKKVSKKNKTKPLKDSKDLYKIIVTLSHEL